MIDFATDARPPIDRRQTQWAIVALAVGFAITVVCGLLSPEGVHQFDDLCHFLYAKWAWIWPAYLLNDWGRPGFTLLYFLPARLGWPACRLLSSVLTAAAIWFAFRIAQRGGLRHAWAVVPFAYVQPLFFQLAQTTLTETALAFYLTFAIFLAARNRWTASAVVLSAGFTTRHEAVVLLPIWLWVAWRRRVPLRRLWPIIWAPLTINVLAYLTGWLPAVELLLQPNPTPQYGHGGWLTYFSRSLEAFGPAVSLLALVGVWSLSRDIQSLVPTNARCDFTGHGRRDSTDGALIAASIGVYFLTQTIIRAFGLYGSGGYARFLVPVSPLVAIAALIGWQRLFARDTAQFRLTCLLVAASMALLWLAMERQLVLHLARLDEAAGIEDLYRAKIAIRIITAVIVALALLSWATKAPGARADALRAALAASILVVMLLSCAKLCTPLARPPEAGLIDEALRRLATQGMGNRPIISANVWLDYATGRALPPDRQTVREQIESAPLGALFAWERQFAGSPDHGLPLEEFISSPAFRLVFKTPPAPFQTAPYLHVFEKIAPWQRPSTQPSRQLAK